MLLRYVSHAEVVKDPNVPVPRWGLSDVGRRRVQAMRALPWLADVRRIVSSDEAKAAESATILADHLGLTVEVRPCSGETDRSATGYVPEARHEELARRLFAEPDRSADGWERAIDAQRRVVECLADLLAESPGGTDGERDGDVLVVGHGGVGTMLYCYLAGLAIESRYDQPGQGHHWTFDRARGEVVHPWRPIELA